MLKIRKLIAILISALSVLGCSSENTSSYPSSNASYAEVNSEVGCGSKYSDNKKVDIFNSSYKNHWMTWSGEVVIIGSDNVSLNVDRKGTQDLKVDFAEKNAGYNLTKGDIISVKFIMKSEGGCILPFSGKNAVIQ